MTAFKVLSSLFENSIETEHGAMTRTRGVTVNCKHTEVGYWLRFLYKGWVDSLYISFEEVDSPFFVENYKGTIDKIISELLLKE